MPTTGPREAKPLDATVWGIEWCAQQHRQRRRKEPAVGLTGLADWGDLPPLPSPDGRLLEAMT